MCTADGDIQIMLMTSTRSQGMHAGSPLLGLPGRWLTAGEVAWCWCQWSWVLNWDTRILPVVVESKTSHLGLFFFSSPNETGGVCEDSGESSRVVTGGDLRSITFCQSCAECQSIAETGLTSLSALFSLSVMLCLWWQVCQPAQTEMSLNAPRSQ